MTALAPEDRAAPPTLPSNRPAAPAPPVALPLTPTPRVSRPPRPTPSAWSLPLEPHGLPGLLIALDGVDGSGKTTTLRMIRAYLGSRGHTVRGFKFPTRELKRSPWFRRYNADPLAAGRTGDVDPLAMCIAVLGDRLITVHHDVLPHLRKGHAVVVDRYLLTPLGELLMHDVPERDREAVEPLLTRFPRPDLSLVADVDAEAAFTRVRRRPAEADDKLANEVYERRVDCFRALAHANPVKLLDTSSGIGPTFKVLAPWLIDADNRAAQRSAGLRD